MSGEQMSSVRERLAREWAPTLGWRPRPSKPPVEVADAPETGVMVALFLDPAITGDLALPGGEAPEQLHVTIVYLGDVAQVGERRDELAALVQEWASTQAALSGEVSGVGLFSAGPTPITYASADLPALPDARQRLVQVLTQAGFEVPNTHGYTPHITLAYADRREANVRALPLWFEGCVLAWAGERIGCPFGAPISPPEPVDLMGEPAQGQAVAPSEHEDAQHGDHKLPVSTNLMIGTGVQESARDGSSVDARTFVTEVSGRTLLTAPAAALAPTAAAASTNEHFLWLQGRFVGADKPNRNNAYWSADDLELGQTSVTHGPLNWLHEARHVIGTIAEARYVPASSDALCYEAAASAPEPHIVASSAIWKWIYPDEGWVVQQASDAGRLWYSMECISEHVQCVGEASCGAQVEYAKYLQGLGCQHMQERSAVRRFVNPTFLGGAVIVPPVRPGWADADAAVMTQAASLAEHAYDSAGRPDISATEWEQLMAQVVRYAQSA